MRTCIEERELHAVEDDMLRDTIDVRMRRHRENKSFKGDAALFSLVSPRERVESMLDATVSSELHLHTDGTTTRSSSDASSSSSSSTSSAAASSSSASSDSRDRFYKETAAQLSVLRERDDALQILVMGDGPSFRVISLSDALAIGRRVTRHLQHSHHHAGRFDGHGAAPAALPGEKHLWLDFCNHTLGDLEAIRHAFSIHPVTIEDCLVVSREKCERFRGYAVVVASELFYRPNSILIDAAQTTLLMFHTVTLTFRTAAHAPSFLPVLHRLVRGEQLNEIPSENWLLYAYLDEIVARFEPFVQSIIDEVLVLDDLVLQYARSEQTDLLRRINIARRRMAQLQSTLMLKRELLEQLCRPQTLLSDAMSSYLRDVHDECSAMLERLTMSFEVLNHLDSIYLTRLSLEVAQSGESMNMVMKKFSAVATIFLPLSTLAGIFGMNVRVPGQTTDDNPDFWWFIGIVLCMLVSGSLVMWLFAKRNLL
jgi:Mg2+ and Co2+ transporter CorA